MSASFLKSRFTLYGALLFFVAQILDFIMQLVHASERTKAGKPLPENFTAWGISWEVFLILFIGAVALLLWRLYTGRSRMRREVLYRLINLLLCFWGAVLAVRSILEMDLFDMILLLDALTYVTALMIPCLLLQISDRLRLVPEEWKLLVPAGITFLFVGLSAFSSIIIIRASSVAGNYSIWLDMPHLLQRAAVALFAVAAVLKAHRIHQTYMPGVSKMTRAEEEYWDRVTTALPERRAPRTEEEQELPYENAGTEEPETENTEDAEGSMTECPGCGKRIPGSVEKCPYCGAEFFNAESVSRLLRKAAERTAGSERNWPDLSEEKPGAAPEEEPEETLPEGPTTECPGCGRSIPDSLDRCPHCGAELVSADSMLAMLQRKRGRTGADTAGKEKPGSAPAEPEPEPDEEQNPGEPMSVCPNCGKWIPDRLDICPYCRAELFRADRLFPEEETEIRLFD